MIDEDAPYALEAKYRFPFRPIRIGPDTALPDRFTAEVTSPGVRIDLELAVVNQRPECIGWHLVMTEDKATIIPNDLRRYAGLLNKWIEVAAASVALKIEETPGRLSPGDEPQIEQVLAVRGRQRINDEFLADVARVYRESGRSVEVVSQHYCVSERTAQRWLQKARTAKLIDREV
jgi:hypothetical protein